MTYDLFEEITQFQCISKDERLRHVTILIREKLPEDNYHILKYIVQFLAKVMFTLFTLNNNNDDNNNELNT